MGQLKIISAQVYKQKFKCDLFYHALLELMLGWTKNFIKKIWLLAMWAKNSGKNV